MAFQQGLSGLNSASRAIDVTSNNIANASTVGFKTANAQFADVYASALSGASTGIQIGIGSTVNAVRQAFTQGNLSTSNNPLDLAINGNGFFRMQRTDGSIAYTRNGQFDIDKDGFIVSAIGDRLTGFPVATQQGAITVFEGQPAALRIDNSNIDPRETESATLTLNLDSREVNPGDLVPPVPDISNYLNDVEIPVESYNYTTSLTVFDSLGNPITATLYFVRQPGTPSPNAWDVYARLSTDVVDDPGNPGQQIVNVPMTLLGTVPFTENGKVDTAALLATPLDTLDRTGAELGTGAGDVSITVSLNRATQFGSPFAVTELVQDGYTTGQITGLVTTRDGIIQGRYSNGQTKDIGRIALANFASPNGLISLGNNLWAESPESGQPIIGSPGTGVLGVISAGVVEDSNVDLTQELVQLIVQQRNYQANAQSIRTQDQILQTLVNLR
ncbi:MAG: flagellar hook protein FlgE [Rhodocyclaceae bacterium]